MAGSNLQRFNATIQDNRTQTYLKSVLAEKSSSFVTSLTSLVANNTTLQVCEPVTLMYAAIKATALGLPFDPNLGMAYCIPFRNSKKGTTEAQFQIGAKGIIQLALRSGQFSRLNVSDVREGELKKHDLLTGDIILEAANNREQLPVIGYVAYFRLTNGFEKSLYWSVEKIKEHAMRYSQTFASKNDFVRKSSQWSVNFDAMAQKTVLKQLLSKYAPMSVEMQQAVQADQSIIRVDSNGHEGFDYVDNQQTGMKSKSELADLAKSAAMDDVQEAEVIEETPAK